MLTLETLLFLREQLGRLTLAVGASDYREASARVNQALDELDAAIAEATK